MSRFLYPHHVFAFSAKFDRARAPLISSYVRRMFTIFRNPQRIEKRVKPKNKIHYPKNKHLRFINYLVWEVYFYVYYLSPDQMAGLKYFEHPQRSRFLGCQKFCT